MAKQSKRPRFAVSAALVLTLCAATLPATAGAKKKSNRVDVTNQANLSIPVGTAATAGLAESTIEVGKRFKGRRIRDVNVTIHIVGTGTNSVVGLRTTLTAPNGATTLLEYSLGPGSQIGPLTLDDEAPVSLITGAPSGLAGFLFVPWQGAAQADGGPLGVMDDGGVRGTWTLRVIDTSTTVHTNTLSFWRLEVATGRALKTKGEGD
jgi:subtilisin-like proprotein convertase family protein